ncbi:hypothetical protein C5167_024446 [Papaver somniferum]|uniref:Homeobox domain-containing protein n=1 Tax=Papaver somniferum TaxID=3469 RepID=A0A4Y7JRN3_PAPSO|nr:homeobox-leucine zipper protein HAT22-like [Papaver somniferum]RZC62692.1 hypothetical protein C5167_024446 [Papaver somniferum]
MGFQVIDGDDNLCNIGLGLGLNTSFDQSESKSHDHADDQKELIRRFKLEPILTLGFSSSDNNNNHLVEAVDRRNYTPSLSSPNSALSNSFSNTNGSIKRSSPSSVIKREKELLLVVGYHEEMEVEKVVNSSSRVVASDEDDEGSARKKLRLTKEQSSLLEDNFKEHSTLNPKQKQALAKQLNLRPRQVEVWFQNRRARTKLKQTEVDCEFLKKCCETLTEENRKLHKELQEFKASKLSQPQSMYMQLPAATLTICPSCEKLGGGGGAGDGTDGPAKNSLTMAPGKPQFYNPFQQHPSAAC